MKKFTTMKGNEHLILSYEKSEEKKISLVVSIKVLGLSFTVDDILQTFYNFSKLFDEKMLKTIVVECRICNGYLPDEFDLYEDNKYTKNFLNTLDDVYQFLYKHQVETDPYSIYNFLSQKYPTIELYCNSLGYLISIIENIINTKKIAKILRKCGFQLKNDCGNMIVVETILKKIIKRYK